MPPPISDADWINRKRYNVLQNGCWDWSGPRGKDGYGKCGNRSGQTLPHRIFYINLVGPIPEGLEIDHLCKNRSCVNPKHLEPVTRQENIKRSDHKTNHPNKVKTHCKRGHRFSPENTMIERYGDREQRKCRACRNEQQKVRWHLKRSVSQ